MQLSPVGLAEVSIGGFFSFVTLISWVSTIYARAASSFDDPFAEYYTVVVSWCLRSQ